MLQRLCKLTPGLLEQSYGRVGKILQKPTPIVICHPAEYTVRQSPPRVNLNRGIEEIRYNFLNLPSKISFTEKNAYIRNMYDANGHKFKMITYASMPLVIGRAASAKASAKAATALTCLVYNIFRYVQINKYQPQLIASMG